MPLAEAIILRRPVLANDLPVMREIGGDWPMYACLKMRIRSRPLSHMHRRGHRLTLNRYHPPLPDGDGVKSPEYETIFNQALVKHRIENPSA